MKKENISDAVGALSDDIIEDAAAVRNTRSTRPYAKIAKFAALAAVFALCIVGVRYMPSLIPPDPVGTEPPIISPDEHPDMYSESPTGAPTEAPIEDPTETLDAITIVTPSFAMGMEALDFYSIDEYVTSSPWKNGELPALLPVYKNPIGVGEYGQPIGTNPDAMRETLFVVAQRLGLDPEALTVTDDAPSAEQIERMLQASGGFIPEGVTDPSQVKASTDEYEICVDRYLNVRITLKNPVALPESYRFTPDSTYDELLRAAEYIGVAYSKLMDFDSPTPRIYGGDYDSNGECDYELGFYDASGTYSDALVSHNLEYVTFHTNDSGELRLIWMQMTPLTPDTYVGDYPIITAEEAEALLKDGHFATSCMPVTPDFSKIAYVELVYRGGSDTYFMPYYRFLVDITGWSEYEEKLPGMHTYGAYYVPAIDGEYITDMPAYEGTFNS